MWRPATAGRHFYQHINIFLFALAAFWQYTKYCIKSCQTDDSIDDSRYYRFHVSGAKQTSNQIIVKETDQPPV